MARLNQINPDGATGTAKTLLDAVKGKMGVVPNITRVMANQPAVLNAYLQFSGALGEGALDGKTTEAIALRVAALNGCTYCASAHTFIAKSQKVEQAEIAANLSGKSGDARTQAVLAFATAIVQKQGRISDADITAARNAGLGDATMTEIVGNVALNIFTNYINNVAQTDVDFPTVELKAAS